MKENTTCSIKQDNSLFSQSFLNLVPLVCSLLVVLIHQFNVADPSSVDISARIVGFVSHGICTAAVPMFFFLSGYLFYRNLPTLNAVFHKQKKRIGSVLMPFLAWSASYYVFFALLSKVLPGELQKAVDLSLIGIIKGIVFYEYAFPLWYMFQLCVFILLAPLLFYVLKNRLVSIIVLVGTAVVGLFITADINVDVGGYERALFQFNFFAYYFAGCFIAKEAAAVAWIKAFVRKLPLIVPTTLYVVFGFIESLFFDEVLLSFNTRCVVPLVFLAFLFMMLKISEQIKHFSQSPVSTMVIYGIHSFVGLVLGKLVLDSLHLPLLLDFFVRFIAVTAVSFGVGYMLKFIKPLYRVFSGNR